MYRTLFLIIFLFSTFGLAQKKELRKAQKLFIEGKVDESFKILEENDALFDNADDKTLASYSLLLAKIARSNLEFQKAFDFLSSIKDVPNVKSDVSVEFIELTSNLINSAIEDNKEKNYSSSVEKLFLAYSISPKKNVDYLYFAASGAVNAQDFDLALEYYLILEGLKYAGVTTKYYVTELESGNEIEVQESEYNIYKKTKQYKDFREEKTESKFPEIVKNIALIYAQKGDNDRAFGAIKKAREENPNDINLILTEANIYIELNEKEKFRKLMNEAIAMDPDNANLYYNLGVINRDLGDIGAARKYYEKAIELDPKLENAYLNLVSLILEGEASIVEEMNNLGTSRAENARYDVLKQKREALYTECIPILKKLIDLDKNKEAIRTLMNIYGTLGDTDGFRSMKALLED
ncbi:MAG: tetratricopeptide repeat protein [Bacteroidota bacterium]|nr:tetratricopeptide repeat protein [Bacteroidota bacterium]